MTNNSFAEIAKKIVIDGNQRISEETIKLYGDIELNKDYKESDLDKILKNLYSTDFFSDVKSTCDDKNELNQIKAKYLGRKGIVTNLFKLIPDIKSEDKALFGKKLNDLKIEIFSQIKSRELVLNGQVNQIG